MTRVCQINVLRILGIIQCVISQFHSRGNVTSSVSEVSKGLKSKENVKQKEKSNGEERHQLCYLNCINQWWCILPLNSF